MTERNDIDSTLLMELLEGLLSKNLVVVMRKISCYGKSFLCWVKSFLPPRIRTDAVLQIGVARGCFPSVPDWIAPIPQCLDCGVGALYSGR